MKITKGMILAFLIALIFMWILLKGVKVTPVTTPTPSESLSSPDLSGGSMPENSYDGTEPSQGY